MKIQLTLEQAYARASEGLRQKMEYSITLLQKAERLALAYDRRGGISLRSAEEKTAKPYCISPSWRAYNTRDT